MSGRLWRDAAVAGEACLFIVATVQAATTRRHLGCSRDRPQRGSTAAPRAVGRPGAGGVLPCLRPWSRSTHPAGIRPRPTDGGTIRGTTSVVADSRHRLSRDDRGPHRLRWLLLELLPGRVLGVLLDWHRCSWRGFCSVRARRCGVLLLGPLRLLRPACVEAERPRRLHPVVTSSRTRRPRSRIGGSKLSLSSAVAVFPQRGMSGKRSRILSRPERGHTQFDRLAKLDRGWEATLRWSRNGAKQE